MRLHLTTDDGQAAVIDVAPGANVWLTPDGQPGPAGSLYLTPDGTGLGLGRYSDELAWWDYQNPLTVPHHRTGDLTP